MKAVLTKEQAEALESALDLQGCSKADVVEWHAKNLWDGKREALNGMSLDILIRALYVGYELEKSLEEKVRELFETYNGAAFSYNAGIRKGIIQTLELLGKKIKGVNY
ncbi:hypothetical protein ABC255_09460 [Neobacillus sp. 3P2-tot-E-2]|uniref:hypothetical protein n=1 Tax=Neobacillus sp. 3P2-tot-E-2 TaxID=3132212 RepID=UPI0039A01310